MRTLRRGYSGGELARMQRSNQPLWYGVLHPTPRRYRHPSKGRCVLTREHLCECGAVREVLTDNLSQLGVREAEPPAPDRCHNSDGGALERIATRTRGKRGTYAAEEEQRLA